MSFYIDYVVILLSTLKKVKSSVETSKNSVEKYKKQPFAKGCYQSVTSCIGGSYFFQLKKII